MKVLVTGVAGFIGCFAAKRFLEDGHEVMGIDNLNDYYDVRLKQDRLQLLESYPAFSFERVDIADAEHLCRIMAREKWDLVLHLAAQAGVRYSITHPEAYVQSNLVGFANILECCRQQHVPHLMFASSSSVYGDDTVAPFTEDSASEHPVSFYAATKRANEAMAASYAHLYQMRITGLRFFTVYGPWGRPDMACYSFTKAILNGDVITLYNYGDNERDFTYIDDVVESINRLIDTSPEGYAVVNVGGSHPLGVKEFVDTICDALGVPARTELVEAQPGDVFRTCASTEYLESLTGFRPQVSIQEGIGTFVEWYREHHSQANVGSLR